jgi:hypothetical protein
LASVCASTPCAGIDDQQRAFARGQTAADFIAEVDMARRVHQIQDIGPAVLGFVIQPDGLRLDGDAALPLDLHRIKVWLLVISRRSETWSIWAGEILNQPVGQKGRFAMVDMGDDGEIHAANLSALKGWEDIVEPLLKALHEPQAPTDALTVLHRLQRLAVVAEMGLGGYDSLHEQFRNNTLPLWSDFATLPATTVTEAEARRPAV